MEENIPSRQQISDKIDAIRNDPHFSTLKEEVYDKISEWIDTLSLPTTVIVNGIAVKPKQQILDDLTSYPNY